MERSNFSDAPTECEDRRIARGSYHCGYNYQDIIVRNYCFGLKTRLAGSQGWPEDTGLNGGSCVLTLPSIRANNDKASKNNCS